VLSANVHSLLLSDSSVSLTYITNKVAPRQILGHTTRNVLPFR